MFYAHRSDKYNFIMCTNGRCGSTALKRWYLELHDMPMPIESDYVSVHQALMYNDPRFFVDPEKFNEMPHYKFLTVRNPWERLVSFYKIFVVINQHNYEGLGRATSFQQLVELLVERGPRDPHTSLQSDGLGGLDFNRTVYVEDFAEGMAAVSFESGVPVAEGYFSKRFFTSPVSTSSWTARKVSSSPGEVFVDTEVWPKWGDFYTPELFGMVSKIYAKDIKAFGYTLSDNGDVGFPARVATKFEKKKGSKGKQRRLRGKYRKGV